MKRKFFEILKLFYSPISIFSPVPFFAIMVFVLAYRTIPLAELPIPLLIAGMSVSLLTSFASNFWNHTNDIIEDLAQGKKNALTENMISQRHAIMISFLLYLTSGFLIGYISFEVKRPSYLFFYIWVLITWWYSDNIFLKRIFHFRLKSHYNGELITYIIAYPTYTLGTWLIYSDLNMTGLILAAAFSCFGISVVLLKDLKDISGDRKAGLRTLGVVFPPSKLLYSSCVFLFLYYIIILSSIIFNIFSHGLILIIIPFFYFLKNTFLHFIKKEWKIEAGDVRQIKAMSVITYFSIIVLGAGSFI